MMMMMMTMAHQEKDRDGENNLWVDLFTRGPQEIAMIKVVAPNVTQKIMDMAIQLHGGKGVSDDTILARSFAGMRTLRIADGPDEVHIRTVARIELKKAMDYYGKNTKPISVLPSQADLWYRGQGRSRL